MTAPYLLWEERFDVSFEGSYSVHEFRTLHKKATVVGVRKEMERAIDGKVEREYGVLLVKDRGFVANEHKETQSVIVIRRIGDLTPLPDTAGELLGTFATDHCQNVWHVFSVRFPEAPSTRQKAQSSPESNERPELSSPPPPQSEESSSPADSSLVGASPVDASPPSAEDSVWP